MNKVNQFKQCEETLQVTNLTEAEHYTAPHIEIIDVELSQNILGGSTGDLPDFEDGGEW